MRNIININERGTLTLPKALRRKLGLHGAGYIIGEEIPEGIELRPVPVELYTDGRLKEFKKNNEEVIKAYSFQKPKEVERQEK